MQQLLLSDGKELLQLEAVEERAHRGLQHQTRRAAPSSTRGSAPLQRSIARSQRSMKRQVGRSARRRSGSPPGMEASSARAVSAAGVARMSWAVYGGCGALKSS